MILARSLSVAQRRGGAAACRVRQRGKAGSGGGGGGGVGLASAAVCVALVGGALGSRATGCKDSELALDQVRLERGGVLGTGSFGVVRKGELVDSREAVAVKMIPEDARTAPVIDSEVRALQRIQGAGGHANVVNFKGELRRSKSVRAGAEVAELLAGALEEALEGSVHGMMQRMRAAVELVLEPGERWLLFEHFEGVELYDKVVEEGPVSSQAARAIVRNIAHGLRFLHEDAQIAHADIKPENVLIDAAGNVKLIDFGCAAPLRGDGSEELLEEAIAGPIGTVAYSAPEFSQCGPLTTAIDVWSLGCIFYVLLSGEHPFDPSGTRSDSSLTRSAALDRPVFKGARWRAIDAETRGLIEQMLTKDPAERIKLDDLLKRLA